jgi:5'-nucleotidase
MPDRRQDTLVVGITSRALFDLDEANHIFETKGLKAYRAYQLRRENVPLAPGAALPLVKALLAINKRAGKRLVEVVLISRNDADSGLRIFNSIRAHKLDIIRAAFVDGRDPFKYLGAFGCKVFLSANPKDVDEALRARFPAAIVYPPPKTLQADCEEVRIAFDGDAVLFSDAAERVFRQRGLQAFQRREALLANIPLAAGPLKGFLEALSQIQRHFPERRSPIRTALVTSRGAPAHERPIKTLREWDIRVDESFFLGGWNKARVLEQFRAHIFFDDQKSNVRAAAGTASTALVPNNGRVAEVRGLRGASPGARRVRAIGLPQAATSRRRRRTRPRST